VLGFVVLGAMSAGVLARTAAADPTCADYGFYESNQKDECDGQCKVECKKKQNCQGEFCPPPGYCWACPDPKDEGPTPPPPPPTCPPAHPNITANRTSIPRNSVNRTVTFTIVSPRARPPINWDFGDGVTISNTNATTVTHEYGCGRFDAKVTCFMRACDGLILSNTIHINSLCPPMPPDPGPQVP
jgi:hypothetical protein